MYLEWNDLVEKYSLSSGYMLFKKYSNIHLKISKISCLWKHEKWKREVKDNDTRTEWGKEREDNRLFSRCEPVTKSGPAPHRSKINTQERDVGRKESCF